MIVFEDNSWLIEKKPIAQLEFAIQKADLSLVKSIFQNPDLAKDIDLSKSSGPLSLACTYGYLDIVQYLLTSKDINKYPDINSLNFLGFQMACINGHLNVVKYLTSSPLLTQHIGMESVQDIGFMSALQNHRTDIIKYFIFELNMDKNRIVSSHLHSHPNEEVENMFKIKNLHKNLHLETTNINGIDKFKRNKI